MRGDVNSEKCGYLGRMSDFNTYLYYLLFLVGIGREPNHEVLDTIGYDALSFYYCMIVWYRLGVILCYSTCSLTRRAILT